MKKVYILPNLVTSANMFCGYYSIVLSIRGQFILASWMILAACVFDLLDGRVARLAHATSQFGVEYDSLSDMVSFGVAPSVLMFLWGLEPYSRLGYLSCFLFLICGALRLARFNSNSIRIKSTAFQGLPIPAAAAFLSSFIIFLGSTSLFVAESDRLLALIFVLLLSSLMVSTVSFPSFKEIHWRSRSSFGLLAVGILMMVFIAIRPEVTLFIAGALYLVGGLSWNLFQLFLKKTKPTSVTKHDRSSPL